MPNSRRNGAVARHNRVMPDEPERRVMRRPAQPSIPELKDALAIDQNALEQCCVYHPTLILQVGEQLAHKRSLYDEGKQELSELEARKDGQIRADAEATEQKVREAEVANQITLDPEVTRLREAQLQIKRDIGELEALMEAFRSRGFILRDLVQLYITQYYSEPSRSMDDTATRGLREARRQAQRGTTR